MFGRPNRKGSTVSIRKTMASWLAGSAPASLEVPNPAGDYADPTGYVPRPVHHERVLVDEQTGLDLSLRSESWRVDLSERARTTVVTDG